jgi:tRNA modification GTPase
VVLAGPPNAGKSSLLNLLLGFERAIVHETPGTTRDTIEERIDLRGIPLRLSDTAGLRDAPGAVEREGVARALRALDGADLALRVWDGSAECPADAIAPLRPGLPEIAAINKADLGEHPSWNGMPGVRISCLTGAGEPELADAIERAIWGGSVSVADVSVAINARHRACLETSLAPCEAALRLLADNASPEFVAVELRAALDALGQIVGATDTERLLDRIFSTFCIGK